MSAAAVMAIVLLLVLLLGVAVGVLLVVAVSARRAHKAVRPIPPSSTWPHLPGSGPDDSGPDERPWWHARGGD